MAEPVHIQGSGDGGGKSERRRIAKRISSLCDGYLIARYTSGKLRTDPLYGGVHGELQGSGHPLLDIGCGMGILAMYLRERGWKNPVSGFDYDHSKISDGRVMLVNGGYEDISLNQGDARTSLPKHSGDVTILDIMQFFDEVEQRELLRLAAGRVAPGGKLIVRSGLFEKNLRFGITWVGDLFARATLLDESGASELSDSGVFPRDVGKRGIRRGDQAVLGNHSFQ